MDWEFKVLDFIRETLSCDVMDAIMKGITYIAEVGWFWILLGVVLIFFKKTRKIGITMLGALLLNLLVCNVTIKPLVGRIRPYDIKEGIDLIIKTPHDFSFPSGHTSASFAGAVALFLYNKKWGGAAVLLAALIGFTRLYLYVHFPTDVLAGAFIGALCAVISYLIVKFVFNKLENKKGIKIV